LKAKCSSKPTALSCLSVPGAPNPIPALLTRTSSPFTCARTSSASPRTSASEAIIVGLFLAAFLVE
jgi:hypothetical protein